MFSSYWAFGENCTKWRQNNYDHYLLKGIPYVLHLPLLPSSKFRSFALLGEFYKILIIFSFPLSTMLKPYRFQKKIHRMIPQMTLNKTTVPRTYDSSPGGFKTPPSKFFFIIWQAVFELRGIWEKCPSWPKLDAKGLGVLLDRLAQYTKYLKPYTPHD